MSVITKVLKQKCVYWAPKEVDVYGQNTFEHPEELNCRWDDGIHEIVDTNGAKVASNAEVMVSEDVVVGGVLMLGTLIDVEIGVEPAQNTGAYTIIQFEKNPNFKCTEFVRTAHLRPGRG